MDVWDVRIGQGSIGRFEAREGHTLALLVLHGTVLVNGKTVAREGQLVHFDRAGSGLEIEANSDASVLWLSGEPIDEPVVGYGPFVLNSETEIRQAIDDFNSGRFGRMAADGWRLPGPGGPNLWDHGRLERPTLPLSFPPTSDDRMEADEPA